MCSLWFKYCITVLQRALCFGEQKKGLCADEGEFNGRMVPQKGLPFRTIETSENREVTLRDNRSNGVSFVEKVFNSLPRTHQT